DELIAPVQRALHETSRILNHANFNPATDSRTITIALTTSTAFVLAPLLRQALAAQAPHCALRLITSNMESPTVFTDDGVDVVLTPQAITSPYPRERLYDDRVVVLASRDTRADATALELITEEPHIIFTGLPTGRAP